jgi:hypothetical protein
MRIGDERGETLNSEGLSSIYSGVYCGDRTLRARGSGTGLSLP